MTGPAWTSVADALGESATPVRFWLRDDDAVAVTPALRELAQRCAGAGAPLLLASIPAGATRELGAWVRDHPDITPCQHGYAHRNQSPAGERATELGGARDDDAVLDELRVGWHLMLSCFGDRAMPLMVPPWNRMRPSLAPHLAASGYKAVSTFAGAAALPGTAPVRLDCDLDIIDWRNGRRGREPADVAHRLLPLIATAGNTGQPIGLLTHHLAHDPTAWALLGTLLPLIATHPGAVFTRAEDEVERLASDGAG